jgi:hypothetical protein
MKRTITLIFLLITQTWLASETELYAQCTNCQETQSNHHQASSAIGIRAKALGQAAFASGFEAIARGKRSTGIGNMIHAVGEQSMIIGHNASTLGQSSMIIGSGFGTSASDHIVNAIDNSLMIGFNSIYPTLFISSSPSRNSTGRVGIGDVTQPQAKLHIKTAHGEQAGLYIEQERFRVVNMYLGDKDHGLRAEDDIGLVFHSRNNYVFRDGAVGIGTQTPTYDLDVNGSTNTRHLRIYDQGLYRENIEGWILKSDEMGNAFWTSPDEFNDEDWLTTGRNIYRPEGCVGIGTKETYGYSLAVNGAILTEEVTVKVKEDWPDYVFEDDYLLIPLEDLQNFIHTNGHLPDVPAAEILLEAGLEVGKMQGLLLKKIEELTLYIIQQDKKINELESQVYDHPSHR